MNYITLEQLQKLLDEYLVENISVYDVGDKTPFFDHIIVCDCSNEKVVNSIANKLIAYCKENDISIKLAELKNSRWIIIDFHNIILNIFEETERTYYNLDGLWNIDDVINVVDDEAENVNINNDETK